MKKGIKIIKAILPGKDTIESVRESFDKGPKVIGDFDFLNFKFDKKWKCRVFE